GGVGGDEQIARNADLGDAGEKIASAAVIGLDGDIVGRCVFSNDLLHRLGDAGGAEEAKRFAGFPRPAAPAPQQENKHRDRRRRGTADEPGIAQEAAAADHRAPPWDVASASDTPGLPLAGAALSSCSARWAKVAARWSWVTSSTAPPALANSANAFSTRAPFASSKFPVGSSASSRRGRLSRARAKAVR